MFVIEKGIPAPDRARKVQDGEWEKLFRSMEIDHSFSFPLDTFTRVRAAACNHGKKLGITLVVSRQQLRCWRVA